MTEFLRSLHNPDVLSCLANLSNDEVFTPPKIVNEMLDLLPEELFRRKDSKFLDPACKSGVFLREIAKRLIDGLEAEIPNLEERLYHIFTKQLYGLAITELTGHMSRRSLYCSKDASGRYSVVKLADPSGNIKFNVIDHKWDGKSCKYCGASKEFYGKRSRQNLETHAYEFIHKENVEGIFKMKFDVVIGNPPYQLSDGGGNGGSAKPIYQHFVSQAKKLNPRYIVMITPSRWFTGGKGLDDYRMEMLGDRRIRVIHDYPEASDCFAGVQIKGGVSYFLWDRDNPGACKVYSRQKDEVISMCERELLEKGMDTFIRYNEAIPIVQKVQKFDEKTMDSIVSTRNPFGLANTFKGHVNKRNADDIKILVSGNESDLRGGTLRYVSIKEIPENKLSTVEEMAGWHKVFIAKAGSGSDSFPHSILTKPVLGEPGEICNESFLIIGPMKNETECQNLMTYISTRFFRFLVLLLKSTQNAPQKVYKLVPIQDFSEPWSDEKLYAKYGLRENEIKFIESLVKPMDLE